jgi:RNA polymerase sigma-70 factor, ECF subfamily
MLLETSDDPIVMLAELVRTERARLTAIARREGLNAEDAVECAHDVLCHFLQILLRGEAPSDRATWPTFIATMTRNAARNGRRRHDRSRPHDVLEDDVSAEAMDTEELVAAAEQHVRLRACVEQLCDTQRAVVTMRFLEERDGEDVATLLGITRGHVDVLLHRAKANLRACLLT